MGLPKQPNCPKPVSSSTTNITLGTPLLARAGDGHAGLDSSAVRPTTPVNGVPSGYSTIGMPHSFCSGLENRAVVLRRVHPKNVRLRHQGSSIHRDPVEEVS